MKLAYDATSTNRGTEYELPSNFIAAHDLWSSEKRSAADGLGAEIDRLGIDFVRVCWPDQHGILRGKSLSKDAFLASLVDGSEATMAPFFFDTANAIVLNPFIRGGGFDDPALSGSPNVVAVPDPETFCVVPWTSATALVLADLYMRDGSPFPYSPRHILRRTMSSLQGAGYGLTIGIELEFYLMRILDEGLNGNPAAPGSPARPMEVAPVARGYSHLSMSHLDEIDSLLAPIARNLISMGIPVRSVEDEWAPGQVELTFEPMDALAAADAVLIMRAAVRQMCRRAGYLATFMCQPGFEGAFTSGWHLHSSLRDWSSGANLMVSDARTVTSDIGLHYVGGTLAHGAAASIFTTPTVNGYRRRRENSLAPNKLTWGIDNRAAMMRMVGGAGDTSTHVENRVGEPSANPYLYIAAQAASGLSGVHSATMPDEPSDAPYLDDSPRLPATLADAVDLLERDDFFRSCWGDAFVEYMVLMKRSELGRFEGEQSGSADDWAAVVTDWEQREYLDLF